MRHHELTDLGFPQEIDLLADHGVHVGLVKKLVDGVLLEEAVENREFPETGGFFFGSDSYEEYDHPEWGNYTKDKEFIAEARKLLAEGFEVYYNSWW